MVKEKRDIMSKALASIKKTFEDCAEMIDMIVEKGLLK